MSDTESTAHDHDMGSRMTNNPASTGQDIGTTAAATQPTVPPTNLHFIRAR
ncbi:20437_t:CDS:2 [Dentiscutata erythropus]|uniref:20437_t:CDS:1 n=1 Tax=Dentiscutata erythropus TaxID=1348616 RepID=A0A9N8W169_9GLOM|nr:20437_t:CDS:2 [Dentiscutata erythropus]